MDPVDNALDCINREEAGPELKDLAKIPPEYVAGNALTDALDVAEQRFGPEETAHKLRIYLQLGNNLKMKNVHQVVYDLYWALDKFKETVSQADFEGRINARIERLLITGKAS